MNHKNVAMKQTKIILSKKRAKTLRSQQPLTGENRRQRRKVLMDYL
jgi:hypothetical protein